MLSRSMGSRLSPGLPRPWSIACAGLLLCSCLTRRASADPMRLGLDIAQGAFLAHGTPYSFTGKLVPAVDFGCFRLGAIVGAALLPPEWDAAVGIAPSVAFWHPVTSATGL